MYTHHVGKKSAMMITMILLVSTLAAVGFVCIETDASDAADTDCNNYYYSQLSPLAKSIYDGAKSADTFQTASWKLSSMTFSLDLDTTIPEADRESTYADAVAAVSDIYTIERVEEFWMGDSWSFNINGDKVDFTVSNIYTENYEEDKADLIESQDDMYDDLRSMMKDIDLACRYTIIKSIHDAMDENCRESNPTEGSMKYRNAMNAFDFPYYGSAEGYAKAFKLACDYYKVPCIVVYGSLTIDGETTQSYWNYVQMEDGKWYLVNTFLDDNGWDTPLSNYIVVGSDSIGKSGSAVSAEMTPSSKLNVPALASTDYSKDRVMIRFIDYDGSYLPESNMYVKGSELNTALVAKYTNDNIGTFEFKGWDKSIPATATEDMTFKAQYTVQFVEYTYIFADEDGTVIDSAKYHYGDKVVAPADPEKAPGKEVVYPFLEWLNYDTLAGYDVSKYPSGKTCTAAYYEVAVGTTFTTSYIQYQINADGTVSIKEFEAKKSYYQSIPIRVSCIVESDKTVSYAVTGFIAGAGLNYDGNYFVLDDSTGSTNPYFSTRNGILYNGDMTIVYSCPRDCSGNSYTAPDSLVEVYPYAFAGNGSDDKNEAGYFEFNEGLKKIGNNAFQYCDLHDFIMPSTVEVLGDNLFLGAGNKSYFGSSSSSFILYRPTMTDIVNETTFAGISTKVTTINTYDKKFTVDGATMMYMANKVGETVTYGGIVYQINSTDLGLGNRYHAVTAIEYTADMTDINLGTFVLGWTMYGSGTGSGLEYYGEVYVCTKVNLDIFSTPPTLKCPTVTVYCGLQALPAGFFSFLDNAYFGVDNTFYGSTEVTGYSLFYTTTALGGLSLNGSVLFAGSDTMYIDSQVAGYIHGIMDYAIKGTDNLQAITFATDFDYLGKGNFDNIKFRNADDTKDIAKTPEALAGKSFTRVGDNMVEVPTLTLNYDTVYGVVTKDTWKSSWSLIQVPLGSIVTVDGNVLSIADTEGKVYISLTATAHSYVPDSEFVGWNLKDGQKITESMTIEAKFKGKPYVYFASLNPDYGQVNAYDRFISSGSTATVNGDKITISGSDGLTVEAVAEEGCAFKAWYYTDSTHVKEPLTSSVTITQSMYFIAEFSGPCKVTFDAGFYGEVDTESINVAPGTTFTSDGNVITFSNGVKVTGTGTAPEHSEIKSISWVPASGTITEDTVISLNIEIETETVQVTITSDNPEYGTIDGKSSVTVGVPYGSTWSLEKDEIVFTFGDKTVKTVKISPVTAPAHYTNRFVSLSKTEGTVKEAVSLTATFAQDVEKFSVTVASSDSKIGTVNGESTVQAELYYGTTWTVKGNDVVFTYKEDTVLTVTAAMNTTPAHHVYTFDGWDKKNGTVDQTVTVTAVFSDFIETFNVTITSSNEDYGAFVQPGKIEYGSTWHFNKEMGTIDFELPNGRVIGVGYTTHADNEHYEYVFVGLSETSGTIECDTDITATFNQVLRSYQVSIKPDNDTIGMVNKSGATYLFPVWYGTTFTVEGNVITFYCEEDHKYDQSFTAEGRESADTQIVNAFTGWNVSTGTVKADGTEIIAHFESKIGTITPDSKGNVTIDSKGNDVKIDESALASIKNAGGDFTISLSEGKVSFDNAAVGKIGSAGEISINVVTDESITKKVDGAKVISVDFGNNHDFSGGKITVTIPYELKSGEKSDDICIGYVNGDKVEQISATYEGGFVTFSVDHLSDFAVLHNDFFNEGGSGSGFPVAIVVVLVIVVLAAAGAIAFVKFKGMPNLKH